MNHHPILTIHRFVPGASLERSETTTPLTERLARLEWSKNDGRYVVVFARNPLSNESLSEIANRLVEKGVCEDKCVYEGAERRRASEVVRPEHPRFVEAFRKALSEELGERGHSGMAVIAETPDAESGDLAIDDLDS